MTRKIALIGSAPSSVALAPYSDPSWQIWACSPGARPYAKRVDAWFEIHLWEPEQPWFSPEYIDFMAKLPVPVYMLEPVDAIPGSVAYPKDEIMRRFGVGAIWFYTSSLAWMFALAIESGAEEIGLWGVDMSAAEEVYTHQRAGCQYWIGKAMEMGIRVTVPPQSDLMCPTPPYGFCELSGMHQKLLARKAELDHRVAVASQHFENARNELLTLRGAAEDVNYVRSTWVQDRVAQDILAEAGVYPPRRPAPPARPAPAELDATADSLVAPPVTWASTPAPNFVNGLG